MIKPEFASCRAKKKRKQGKKGRDRAKNPDATRDKNF